MFLRKLILDINECLNNETCTNADCTNSDGSFTCTCNSGYKFDSVSEETVCVNIDECTDGVDKCEQLCTDTEGSYDCSCNSGYSLNDDGCTCTADNATGKRDICDELGTQLEIVVLFSSMIKNVQLRSFCDK